MSDLNHQDEAFYYLWKNGERFLSEEDMDSLLNGAYSNKGGKVEGYTIKGLKQLAKQGKCIIDGLSLNEEEVEILFSYVRFNRQFSKNT